MKNVNPSSVSVSKERAYNIVIEPRITEKATRVAEHNQVIFQVPLTATKPEIMKAVEGIFGVKVVAVNTVRQKGKVKQFRGNPSRRSDTKKAIVTLAEGSQIDMSAGIG